MCSLPVRTTLFPYTTLFRSDEINRTPPKTQSALLEAMEERQVTVDGRTMPLPDPFMVIATQNPVEYEGTYTLPEAQLDRFLLKQIGRASCRERVSITVVDAAVKKKKNEAQT